MPRAPEELRSLVDQQLVRPLLDAHSFNSSDAAIDVTGSLVARLELYVELIDLEEARLAVLRKLLDVLPITETPP